MNTKTLLIVGGVAVAGYLAWRWYQKRNQPTTSATSATPARSGAAEILTAAAGSVDALQDLGESIGLINP